MLLSYYHNLEGAEYNRKKIELGSILLLYVSNSVILGKLQLIGACPWVYKMCLTHRQWRGLKEIIHVKALCEL